MTDAHIPKLNNCSSTTLLNYFENSWKLEEILMKSLVGEETFFLNPDPLRNKLIFYLGHTAVFYINKLIQVGLLKNRINPHYETLFEIGVDPETPAELEAAIQAVNWPDIQTFWEYRDNARAEITAIVHKIPLDLPIHQQHPIWALLMGIEHSRIHVETSSMLLRQLPIENLKRPQGWNYAPSNGEIPHNQMREIPSGVVKLGKHQDDLTFGWDGWDSEYGDHHYLELNSEI